MPEFVMVAIRSLFSFLVLFTFARVLGKKQISHLTFFDYVVGIVIGAMASAIAIDTSMKVVNGLTGLLVYTLLSVIIAKGAIKSFKIRDLVESSPAILIKDGKIMEETLQKHKMTFDDLLNGLRMKGAFNLTEVELAMLETDGQISVMKKPDYQPLTPKDISLKTEEDHAPSLIIIDGYFLEKRLAYLGYTTEWLMEELKKQGANQMEDVFLAQIESNGTVYVDLYDDKSAEPEEKKQHLSAALRRNQAEIENAATQTRDQNAKRMYFNQSKELQRAINKINPSLYE